MGKQVVVAIVVVALAAVMMMLIIKARPAAPQHAKPDEVLTVDALKVSAQNLSLLIAAQGNVEPKKQTQLSAEVSGKIARVSSRFIEGGFVKSGEFLLKIDDTDLLTELQRARAAVASAQSELELERSRARIARQEWEWRENKNISASARDTALRKPQLQVAQSRLDAARLDVKNVQEQLQKTVINAPYDAIVRSKQVEEGQFVSPGAPLGVLFSTAEASVRLAVAQEKLKFLDVPNLKGEGEKKPVYIYEDESRQAGTVWQGFLERSEGVVDPQTHFIYLVADVKDPYSLAEGAVRAPLRIGSFIYADIVGKTLPNLIKLPNTHIRSGKYVWLVKEDNTLEKREVDIVYSEDNFSYINRGLNTGDMVCTTVITGYLEGTKVKINHLATQQMQDPMRPDRDVSLPSATVEQQVSVPASETVSEAVP